MSYQARCNPNNYHNLPTFHLLNCKSRYLAEIENFLGETFWTEYLGQSKARVLRYCEPYLDPLITVMTQVVFRKPETNMHHPTNQRL